MKASFYENTYNHIFEIPLFSVGEESTDEENKALEEGVKNYRSRKYNDDFSALTSYLETYPSSSKNAAILLNLGLEFFRHGRFSKTIKAFEEAWHLSKDNNTYQAQRIASRAFGEMVLMHARLGHKDELKNLFVSVEGRNFVGTAASLITSAREGLWNMMNRPEISFCCGPFALHSIIKNHYAQKLNLEAIRNAKASTKGFSLFEVWALSRNLKLDFQMAFKEKGAKFIVPSVAHLKVNHYVALVAEKGDRFHWEDSTFRTKSIVSFKVLEEETSGYFLIPNESLQDGWKSVSVKESKKIYGKGEVGHSDMNRTTNCDLSSQGGYSCNQNDCKGMAVSKVHLMLANLNISDDPVGYKPPFGPEIRFPVRYMDISL